MTVDSAAGFPTQYPYTLIIEPDTALEEVVDVTAAVGNILTITRGVDSTTASAHAAGSVVYHGVSARDPREANAHVNATTDVHGTTGSLVDTDSAQTIVGAKNFTGGLTTPAGAVVTVGGSQTITGAKTFDVTPTTSTNGDVATLGGAQTFSGTKTFQNTVQNGTEDHNGAEDHSGAEVHTGTETHSGTETHNGAVTFTGNITVNGDVIATDALWSGTYGGTTDANGFVTVAHAAGFTPTGGWAVTTNPSASFAQFWGIDTITGASVRLRFANAGGNPLVSLPVVGRLFLVRP
jgi:hypothetical protein